MAEELTIKAGKLEENGKRLVITIFGGKRHDDRFDTDVAFQRQKWREDVIKRLRIQGPYMASGDSNAVVHEELEEKLQQAVDAADSEPAGNLWQPSVTAMASIESLSTEWLWDGFLPLGAISGIDGDPGLGKSQLTIDLAARVSRGDAMPPLNAPDGTYKPRGVLMMNAEDDPARTLRPRLEAAGADLRRVHCLRTMSALDGEEERPVSLPGDLAAIEQVIRRNDVSLVILDPFVAYLDGKLSVNSDADVRQCLGQVATLAQTTGAAFVLVRHLNKKSGLSAVYRGGGSIGITGAARSVFMVGVDPVDPDSRIFACVKSNLAPEPQSLRFSIETVGHTSRIRWGEACDLSAHDICAPTKERRGSGGKCEAAKQILSDILADGSRGSNEIESAMEEAGISKSTYWRARREIGVEAEKSGFNDGQWLLSLPIVNGFNHEAF